MLMRNKNYLNLITVKLNIKLHILIDILQINPILEI